jgi:tetratricopeptide (TPR) repeat protein
MIVSRDDLLQELNTFTAPGLSGATDSKAWLKDRPHLLRPAVVEVLAEAVRQRVRDDVDEAMRLAEAALAIAGALGDPASLGRGCRAKANAFWYKNNFTDAVDMFEQAVAHFEQTDRLDEIGRTLSGSIQSLSLLGRYAHAFEAAERAREIFRQIDDPWRLARLEINIANIYHRQDRFAEALDNYQRAYDRLLPYKDAEGTAVALHNIAVCLIILDDFERAMDTWRNAREVSEKNGMPRLAAQADYNIAWLYFMRGDYETALDGLRTSRERCRENDDSYHAALCDLDQSEIYIELNLPEEAASLAQSARLQFEKMRMDFETARSIANLAIARHQQRDTVEALHLFESAAAIFQRGNNKPWQALIQVYQALILFETGFSEAGAHAHALRLSSDALNFFEASGLERRAVVCHLLMARVSLGLGNLIESRDHCDSAMRKIAGFEAPLLNYQAHLLRGHIERAGASPRRAREFFQKARLHLETLRGSLQQEELKISFFRNKLDVYENLIDLCLKEKSVPEARRAELLDEAFLYMEHAKSRTLLELVSGRGNPMRWRATHGPDGDRLRTLRSELNWYYRRIEIEQTSKDGIRLDQIDNLWSEARKREDQLLRLLRELPGTEHDTFPRESGAITLEQIRSALDPRAAILEYTQVGPRILAAVVTRENVEIAELGQASEIAACIRSLHFQLSKPGVSRLDGKKFARQLLAATECRLEELYRFLIAPVAHSLNARHLIIVPHGVLHYVPFHALSEAGAHLIDRFTISYAPSASVYAACHRNMADPGTGSLLLGVSDAATPWIPKEIRSIASVVPGPSVYTGKKATTAVLRASGPTSRFIHIATHGLFRKDNPMFSSVRLADANLNLHDLYDLRLPAELLTLSGCGTGLNVIAEGDELLGLMRGLLSTGAQSLLLTLWDVHDRTTALFMSSFYERLFCKRSVAECAATDSDKARALQEAMLHVREHHPHPYYWAPFFLVGKVLNAAN